MNIQFFKKWFESLDKGSEEFQNVFELVNDSYWDIKDPDDHQQAAKLLNTISTRGEFAQVALIAEIAKQIYKMEIDKIEALTFEIGLAGRNYNVDISTNKTAFNKMKKILENTVMVKAREEGLIP